MNFIHNNKESSNRKLLYDKMMKNPFPSFCASWYGFIYTKYILYIIWVVFVYFILMKYIILYIYIWMSNVFVYVGMYVFVKQYTSNVKETDMMKYEIYNILLTYVDS